MGTESSPSRNGSGEPARFHEFGSDQIYSGIGVSPDGRWAAYIDRAGDGFFQVFRVPLGGEPEEGHLRPDPQDPARLVPARRPDRLHRLQLPGPLLADPSVLAGPLKGLAGSPRIIGTARLRRTSYERSC